MLETDVMAGSPEEVGIDSERLEALYTRVQRDIDEGVLTSAQIAVARRGKVAGFRSFGMAVQNGEARPASNDTLFNMFSATKAIVAAAVWTLVEQDLLSIDERVADIIPEFGTNGKDVVTVEQAFLHVGGFPEGKIGPGRWERREERLKAFSEWELSWKPGSRFQYHATSLHWVLVEIIERGTGKDFRAYIRERIMDPLGLEHLYVGLPAERSSQVALVRYAEEPKEPPGGFGEVSPQFILDFNRPEVQAVGVPGAGGVGRAAELALFYQALVNGGTGGNGAQVLKPETIEWATQVRTTDKHRDAGDVPVHRALGVVVAGDDGMANQRGFGRNASPRAFGHGGAGGQVGWGDPVSGISVAYFTDSFVNAITSGRRMTAVGSLAAATAVEAE